VLFRDLDIRILSVASETADNRRRLEDAVATLSAGGHRPVAELMPGQADKVIAEAVERDGIDLLVMGAYGHSRIRSMIIGSTTSEMIRACKIPVLLFR
jgi:nucleotide-binding universal stress UspA family protein